MRQHALGHYCLSFAFPVTRNLERGLQAYARTNQSPAGAGILTGSGYPIDRRRTAELLGFDGVLPNTRDAVWSEDHTLDATMVAVQAITNVSRLAQDLELWATYEFGMVELADRHSSTSSIMPQKKNPYALEYLRSLGGAVHGGLMSTLSILKAPSEEIDFLFFQPRLYELIGQVARGCTLLARVLDGLVVHRERMAELAGASFTQATDLADIIGLEHDLAFRTAHRIVGTLVRLASERHLTPRDVTPALLDEAAEQVIQRPLGWSAAQLQALLDPAVLVARRQLVGGPAPDQVRRQADECAARLEAAAAAVQERRARLEQAERRLLERAADLAAGGAIA
jgi:argininosuccinate lyase